MDTQRPVVAPEHSVSLRTVLIAAAIVAVAYVAVIGVHLTARLTPAAVRLRPESQAVLVGFAESRERADHHDRAITALWSLLRVARVQPVPLDTLEALRGSLQRFASSGALGPRLEGPQRGRVALAQALAAAQEREAELRGVLLGVVAALEERDLEAAQSLLGSADSLDTPLNEALTAVTEISMLELQAHEEQLARIARESATFVWLWLLAGVATLPFAVLFLRRRLYEPLALLDRGLHRIARGDLAVQLPVTRDDELGRLQGHFNLVAESLRERARQEQAAHETLAVERTRRVIDAALEAVVVLDADGLVREWNPQAAVVFGWSRGEMIGVHLPSLFFGEGDSRGVDHLLEDAFAGRLTLPTRQLRAAARRRDGSTCPVEVSFSMLEGGERREVALFIRDLSHQQAARTALEESESRYRAAFEQSGVGMAEIDPSGRIQRINRATSLIVGRRTEDVIGRQFTEISASDPTEDMATFDALVRGDLPFVRIERAYRRSDSSVVWVDLTAAPVRDPSGRLLYVFATVQDVSQRKRLENELRQAQKMDAIGQLAGGVAHDFNNLLAGIMGYADLLAHESSASEAVKGEARAIVQTARRGSDLAKKLLSLSRQAPSKLEPLDLHEVVAEVHAIIVRAFDRSVELVLDLDDEPSEVRGDRSQLSNAVLNLALNARDAMPHGGRLTFRSRRVRLDEAFCSRFAGSPPPGDYIALSVADTGTGMPEDVRERVFEPFFTTKSHGKGTGLGLAMVYSAVRSHDGIVAVDSAVGAGTTFTIYLRSIPRSVTRPTPAAALPLISGEGHVLLADDETTVREVGARMLRRLGFLVDAVSDGEQAVAQFRVDPDRYAFVVLDGDMPRMTGRDAAREILGIRPDTTLFLATGYRSPSAGTDADAVPPGFAAVLPKPFTLSELSRLIGEHLTTAG